MEGQTEVRIKKKRRRKKPKPKRKTLIILLSVAGLLIIFAALAWARGSIYRPSEWTNVKLPFSTTDSYTPPHPTHFLNTLLLGVDEDGLSDIIIIFSLNLQEDLIVITSVSRNAYVNDQDWADPDAGRSHLTYASYTGMNPGQDDYHNGAANAAYWVEHLLGITIHEYALITYDSFMEMIDLIGGLEIYVDPAFANIPLSSMSDERKEQFNLPTGMQRLNGEQVLAFARFRGDDPHRPRIEEPGSASSEGDRLRRNQQLLRAAYQQVRTMNLRQILDLAGEATRKVHTSISFWDITYLAPKVYNARFDQMMTIVIPGEIELFPAEDRGEGYYEYFHIDFEQSNAMLEGIGLR